MDVTLALLLVIGGVVGYVGYRASQASRRGESAGAAALQALRVVGPPALVAVVAIVLALAAAVLLGYAILRLLAEVAFGDEGDGSGLVLLVGGLGLCAAMFGLAAEVTWGVTRIWRNRRR